jgi:hypothetical protein
LADTKYSALTAGSVVGTHEFGISDGTAVSKKITITQLADFIFARINGSSGAAGPYKTLQKLSSNSADQTSVTPAAVMTTTGVGVGWWHFRYTVIYQAAATTTGIRLNVNHSGTTGQFTSVLRTPNSTGTASNGIGLGVATQAIGTVESVYPERVKNTTSFASVGVVDVNADIQAGVEGLVEVTVSGSLELKLGTEVAASAVRLMAGSMLELTKVG